MATTMATTIATNNNNTLLSKSNTCDIFARYVSIMNEYLLFFTTSAKNQECKKKGRENMFVYTLLKGVATLSHVFQTVLLYTDNIDMAIEKTTTSIYLYTQFIEQLEDNIMLDLNVSATSAAVFVYKKTLNMLDVKPSSVVDTNASSTENAKPILKNLELLTTIYRDIIHRLFIEYKNDTALIINTLAKITYYLCSPSYVNKNEELYFTELENILTFTTHFHVRQGQPLLLDYITVFIQRFKDKPFTSSSMLIKINEYNNIQDANAWSVTKYLKWITS